MKPLPIGLSILIIAPVITGCEMNSDDIQRVEQEKLLMEGTAQTGMPSIKNFRMRKLLKMILELQDQENLNTYTYTYSEVLGEKKFFCNSVGYGIPYATQYTNPEKLLAPPGVTIPQADPTGLFSPASADATWVMCKSPDGKITPVYMEPKIIVSTYKL
jgi:hypothetical protein